MASASLLFSALVLLSSLINVQMTNISIIVTEQPAHANPTPISPTGPPETPPGPTTAPPVALTGGPADTQLSVEDPQVAAKQIKGGPELFQTDSIKTERVLASKCKSPKDCESIHNATCVDEICDCITGFIPSKHSLEKCVKVPTGLGDECEEEAQCYHIVPNSECQQGRCQCPSNYVFDQRYCWERQILGGNCNISLQCDNIAFSMCVQGVCDCQTPLIPSPNNKCLPSAGHEYRAFCEENIQCTHSYGDEAHCSNSQCVCTNNYHFNGTNCVPDKKLGDPCLSDNDCDISDVAYIEGSRICMNNNCSCALGFTSFQGEDICTKSSAEELAVSFIWIICIVIAKFYLS